MEDTDDQGWLLVKREPSGENFSIPKHLKVEVDDIKGGREYFIIKEGVLNGKRASVSLINGSKSRFTESNPHQAAAKLTFNRKTKKLTYGGMSIDAFTGKDNPIPKGTFKIEIPDAPHRHGQVYHQDFRVIFSTSWFRIATTDGVTDRYLHVGSDSGGCLTVGIEGEIEQRILQQWDNLYNYLIKRRSGDGKSVGTVQVQD